MSSLESAKKMIKLNIHSYKFLIIYKVLFFQPNLLTLPELICGVVAAVKMSDKKLIINAET